MSELFGRVWRFEVARGNAAEVFEGLDIRATARWSGASGAPTVDLEVFHPPPTLIGRAADPESIWRVLAGYESAGGPSEIGGGAVIPGSVRFRRGDVDPVLSLQLSARGIASRRVLSATWDSTSAAAVLDWVRGELGLAADFTLPGDVQYARGYSIQGPAPAVLGELARDLGCAWEIEGSTLRLWPRGQVRVSTAEVLEAESGLLEAPEVDGDGSMVRCRCALRPGLRPGMIVRAIDPLFDGELVLTEAVHDVDSAGDTWESLLTGAPR